MILHLGVVNLIEGDFLTSISPSERFSSSFLFISQISKPSGYFSRQNIADVSTHIIANVSKIGEAMAAEVSSNSQSSTATGSSNRHPGDLYPPIEPYNSGWLTVSDIHAIYYEECGNKDGSPIVYL